MIDETWGILKFFVCGIDVCQYQKSDKIHFYEWSLIYIIEWFGENLKYILNDEKFPLPVEGQNSLELLEQCLMFDSDNDDDFDTWFDIKQNWEFKHSWFSNRAGSFLPDIFFRRVNEQIEIAWNNESIYSLEGVSFVSPIGIKYVPMNVFESTVKNFIEDFFWNVIEKSQNKIDAEVVYRRVKELIS